MVFGIVRSLLVGRRGRSGTFFRFLEGFPLTAIDQKKEEELFGFRIQAIYPPFFPSSRRSASFPRFRVVPPLGRLTCITMTIDPLTLELNVAPEHHNGEMAHEDQYLAERFGEARFLA